MTPLQAGETAHGREGSGEVQPDDTGDVVFDDGLVDVHADGRLHVGDGSWLRSRLPWKDLDLGESKPDRSGVMVRMNTVPCRIRRPCVHGWFKG